MLGHDQAMFLKVYSHLGPGDLEPAADRLQTLIGATTGSNVHQMFTGEAN